MEMDTAFPSFQLAEFVSPRGLTGRNCGSPLEPGMIFNRLRRTRFYRDCAELKSEVVDEPRIISLTLERIEALQRTLEGLGPGMTALLEVSGASIAAICEELSRLPEDEYLSIEVLCNQDD